MNNFDKITKTAQEITLERGTHLPQVLAFGTNREGVPMVFANLPDTAEDRRELLFFAGLELAKKEVISELTEAYFICEAWMAGFKKTEAHIPPSQSPNRIEVLFIIGKDTAGTMMRSFKMIRDPKGKLIELKKELDTLSAEAPLLDAFFAGYNTYDKRKAETN